MAVWKAISPCKPVLVDQAYTAELVDQDAVANYRVRVVLKLSKAKCGFVLLPRRWVVELNSRPD